MNDVRLALLGAGRWGRNIIETAAGIRGARIAAVASRNPDTRDLVPAAAVDPDWRAVVARPDIDAVVIAMPPVLHAETAAAVIARGLPAFIEKPLTLDVAQAHAIQVAADRADSLVMVDHLHLFHSAYRALKRRAGDLGAVRSIESVAGAPGPFRDDATVLWDWGAHDVAMCLDLLQRTPTSVAALRAARRATPRGVGETVKLRLEFKDGITVQMTLGNLFDAKVRRFAVDCDDGRLIYEDFAAAPLTVAEAASREAPVAIPVEDEPPLTCALREFVEAVRAGSRDRVGLDLGVRVVETLARCDAALNADGLGRG